MSRLFVCTAVVISSALNPSAFAQHGQGPATGAAPLAASPYAGLESREIKALSPEQIEDLRAGRGMGLALAAELNGYPGPTHVIELADPLRLTSAQRAAVEELLAAMRAETIPLGLQVIAAEAELDRLFRERTVTSEALGKATAEIAELEGELRAAHLRYHLRTLELLMPEQIEQYTELRGYTGENPHRGHGE
jgi:Spy/CpxP family protein refolding chaperone